MKLSPEVFEKAVVYIHRYTGVLRTVEDVLLKVHDKAGLLPVLGEKAAVLVEDTIETTLSFLDEYQTLLELSLVDLEKEVYPVQNVTVPDGCPSENHGFIDTVDEVKVDDLLNEVSVDASINLTKEDSYIVPIKPKSQYYDPTVVAPSREELIGELAAYYELSYNAYEAISRRATTEDLAKIAEEYRNA